MTNTHIRIGNIHITSTDYPKGFQVTLRDADEFTSRNRWFGTLAMAIAYAKTLTTRLP